MYRYDKHRGYCTRKESNDWKALAIARKWAENHTRDYIDEEALRYGGPPYSSYEMEQIAINAFLLGRDYGRQERATEKNKVIRRLKKKLNKDYIHNELFPQKATGDENGSWTSVVVETNGRKVKYDYHLNRWIDVETNNLIEDGTINSWKYI